MVVFKQYNPVGNARPPASRLRMFPRACHRCRSLHKKCDFRKRNQTCSNCKAGGAQCRGGGSSELQIRFSELSHSPAEAADASVSSTSSPKSRQKPDGVTPSAIPNKAHQRDIPSEPSLLAHQPLHIAGSSEQGIEPSSNPLPHNEAKLVKHFFIVLIPWFDYCWASAPFKSYIKYALRRDQGILYAVMAVSARYLEAVGSDNFDSNEYERRCLGILIPMLNDKNSAEPHDDGLLVSALLLRLLDEMTDPEESHLIIRHTVSAPLLLRMRQRSSRHTELSNAAMTIVLRQEILVANMVKRPVELMGRDCDIDDGLGPATDVMWAHRMTAHAARVTNYAYGSEPRALDAWDLLWRYLEDWDRAKPPSFEPLNDSSTESHVGSFSALYYLSDCAVSGRQYLEVCKIILLAHDPRTPSLGLGRLSYLRTQEEKIRNAVRTICGIWLSNQEYVPARVLAGLAIGMTGELFTEVTETARLLEILLEAERHVGWPCLKVSPGLRRFWGLEDAATG